MDINYDFADLETFLAVKETGSFHLASQRLNLSQSAVTRRIMKLEAALDSVLFDRTTRRVRPTLAAKRLQARAEAILNDARQTTRAMRDESVAFAHQRGQIVTVATIPTVVAGLLLPAIRAFRGAGHAARIRIMDFAANEVSEAVADGEADFGICSVPVLEPNIAFELLFEDRMGLVLPGGHALARKETVDWAELTPETLILPARRTGNRVVIDESLARAGLTLQWTFETERSTTALALVADGAGAAILPRSSLTGASVQGIKWRPLGNPVVTRPVGLLSQRDRTPRPAAAALKEAVLKNRPWRE